MFGRETGLFFAGGLGRVAWGSVEGDASVAMFVAGTVDLFAPGAGTEGRVVEIVRFFYRHVLVPFLFILS